MLSVMAGRLHRVERTPILLERHFYHGAERKFEVAIIQSRKVTPFPYRALCYEIIGRKKKELWPDPSIREFSGSKALRLAECFLEDISGSSLTKMSSHTIPSN
jgi:hypothetical protein